MVSGKVVWIPLGDVVRGPHGDLSPFLLLRWAFPCARAQEGTLPGSFHPTQLGLGAGWGGRLCQVCAGSAPVVRPLPGSPRPRGPTAAPWKPNRGTGVQGLHPWLWSDSAQRVSSRCSERVPRRVPTSQGGSGFEVPGRAARGRGGRLRTPDAGGGREPVLSILGRARCFPSFL